jgi:hypothetical protein
MQEKTPPPAASMREAPCIGNAKAALVGAVVLIVRTAVLVPPLVTVTGFVAPKLNVGGSCAPAGLDVMVAANSMVPVKPPLGAIVIVAEFPEVAPGAIEVAVPLMAKLG